MWSLFFVLQLAWAQDKCRALVIGGATDYGAYEAGAIIGLVKNLPSDHAQWDIVTGNGIGAINALIVSQYEKGDEGAIDNALNQFWTQFSASVLYEDWFLGALEGLTEKSGLFNSAPMLNAIESLMRTLPKRWLSVGATDLLSADYVLFNSTSNGMNVLMTGVYASASDYGTFPYVKYGQDRLVSGSVLYIVDILHAVDRCIELGFSFSDIVVDIVLGAGKKLDMEDLTNYNTLQMGYRYLEIYANQWSMDDITNAMHYYPEVNFRSVVFPSKTLPSSLFPYNYGSEDITEMLLLGQRDAAETLKSN